MACTNVGSEIPISQVTNRCFDPSLSSLVVENIVLMQNLDPAEWQHVSVNFDQIHKRAIELAGSNHLKEADWKAILPRDLGLKDCVDYIMGLICIDFCHWDLKPNSQEIRNFYAKDDLGTQVRGSAAMTALVKKAYNSGYRIFDCEYMQQMSAENLRLHLMGVDKRTPARFVRKCTLRTDQKSVLFLRHYN